MTDQAHRGARVAAVWSQLLAALARYPNQAGPAAKPDGRAPSLLDVVDVGGGSGTFAVPLAELGHRVTVVDPSPNALATLNQRASEADVTRLVNAVQGDAAGLVTVVGERSADVVLCHGVLEVVDDPVAALAGLAACLRPAGFGSIVVAQRNAAAIGKALAGHLIEARHLLEDPDGRWGPTDPLPRRFSEPGLVGLLAGAGLVVEEIFGVRVFADLVPGALVDDPADVRALAALESTAATLPEMRTVASALHVIVSGR